MDWLIPFYLGGVVATGMTVYNAIADEPQMRGVKVVLWSVTVVIGWPILPPLLYWWRDR